MAVKKGKKLFGVFNIIDVVIVLFVVLAFVIAFGGGIVERVVSSDEQVEIEYELYISGVRDFTVNAMETGMILLDGESGAEIGVVSNIKRAPTTEIMRNQDGTISTVSVPNRYTVTLTVEATATSNSKGYYAGGRQIAANENIQIVSVGVATSGVVLSVKETV